MAHKNSTTPEISSENAAILEIIREHIMPSLAQHGVGRLAFVQEKIVPKDLPHGMSMTPMPAFGKIVRTRGQHSNVIKSWPLVNMEVRRYPGFFFVYAGEADLGMGDAILHCPAGYGAVVPAGVPRTHGNEPHWSRARPEKAHSDILWVNLTSFGAECHYCNTRGPWHHSDYSWYSMVSSQQIFELTNQLVIELEQRSPKYELVARDYLTAIFSLLLRHFTLQAQPPRASPPAHDLTADAPSTDALSLERAKTYIDNRLTYVLTLEDIAHSAYVSRTKLSKLFREEMDMSVWDYVLDRRIQKAKTLLEQTDLFVYRVGYLTGFASPTTFIARFTKAVGFSPNEFRRQIRSSGAPDGHDAD